MKYDRITPILEKLMIQQADDHIPVKKDVCMKNQNTKAAAEYVFHNHAHLNSLSHYIKHNGHHASK